MPTIERSVTVEKSIDKVWEYLADFTNTEEWDPPTLSTVVESGNGGVGTVYHNVSKVLGHEAEIRYTVTDFEPNRLLRLTGINRSVEATDTMRFESDGRSTTVHYRADLSPHGVAKLAEPLMGIGLKRLGDNAATSLRSCLERL